MLNPKNKLLSVLCVEDESVAMTLLAQIVRPQFGNLFTAKDGIEGLELFRRHRPALVITDILMPNMDGISLARAIKAESPETMIIVTTARGDSEMLLSAIEVGVSDYLVKPLVPERLNEAIEKCLRFSAMERELRTSKARIESILESIGDAFFVLDGRGHISYLNRKAEDFFGFSPEHLPEHPALSMLPEFRACWDQFQDAISSKETRSFEHFTPSLGLCHEVRIYPFGEGVSVYLRDITERKIAEERISTLALFDKLTGLPNRALLQERLDRAIARMNRTEGRCALLFLDLDHFKNINDSLGHGVGDLVLKEVANRLRSCIRETDTASRQGGDEFIILLEKLDFPESIHTVSRRILQSIAQEIQLQDLPVTLTASIGISFFPDDGKTAEELLKAADTAMYHGKQRGRNTYQFYRKEMDRRAQRFLQLDKALRTAVANKEFLLHYQPQFDLKTRALVGFEALVRWRHPQLGVIPPGDFIALAEETGCILPLGEWVLDEACKQARQWLDLNTGPLRMAVNLSRRQFWQEDLVATIKRILDENGLPPHCLELEITESMIMTDVDIAISKMEEIKALGVGLAIDDFGTGYSSLAALKRFPIQRLKVDKSFIQEVATHPSDAAIVSSIINLAHTMNLSVMAEGIETQDQCDFLLENNCELGQGFLFSRPIPPAQVEATLLLNASGPGGLAPWQAFSECAES